MASNDSGRMTRAVTFIVFVDSPWPIEHTNRRTRYAPGSYSDAFANSRVSSELSWRLLGLSHTACLDVDLTGPINADVFAFDDNGPLFFHRDAGRSVLDGDRIARIYDELLAHVQGIAITASV